MELNQCQVRRNRIRNENSPRIGSRLACEPFANLANFLFLMAPDHKSCAALFTVFSTTCVTLPQLVKQKKYFGSDTHRRLIHEDQCTGIGRFIPDTNGAGVPNGPSLRKSPASMPPSCLALKPCLVVPDAAPLLPECGLQYRRYRQLQRVGESAAAWSKGRRQQPGPRHCTGGLPKGGGHSGVAHFFLFLLLAGVTTIGLGVWWSQVGHTYRLTCESKLPCCFQRLLCCGIPLEVSSMSSQHSLMVATSPACSQQRL